MKHEIRIAIVIFGFLVLWSCSPNGAPATTPGATIQPADFTADKAAIVGLEKEWAEAIVNRDMATLNEIIADDFVGTSWSGDTYVKTRAVEDIEFRVYVAESLALEGINVNVFGDTAVVTLTQVEKSKYGGQECSGRYGYADVWMKRDGRWQAVSSYGRVEAAE
jgi:ketosteroid isomerase-like protein